MEPFIYESGEFRIELKNDPHLAGEIEFLRSIAKPGMNVLDVGLHRGVTTVALAKSVALAGHVYAFEPVPEFYNAVRENLSRNQVKNVDVFDLALSDQKERLRFYKRGGGSGIVPGKNAEVLTVKATTMADFVARQDLDEIDLLSMDCEGSELRVFQGAGDLLRKQAPQIFCEIHHGFLGSLGKSAGDVAEYLEGFGYRVQPLSVEALDAKPALEECSHIYARKSHLWKTIEELEGKIRDLKGRMPAHSIKTSMIQELEKLEKQIKEKKEKSS